MPEQFTIQVNRQPVTVDDETSIAAEHLFAASQTVVDMVYGDRRSPLLEAAETTGAATVDGLEILVQQGARSLEIWTGRQPDLDVMRRAAARR